eukprot:gene25180-10817_t
MESPNLLSKTTSKAAGSSSYDSSILEKIESGFVTNQFLEESHRHGEEIESGFVTYKYFEGRHRRGFSHNYNHFKKTAQGYAYSECLREFKDSHTFIGFIDVDEFISIQDPEATSINDVLSEYEDAGAVGFHWRIVGPSDHVKRPNASVVTSYTYCLPRTHNLNRQFKTFVNTKFNPMMISAHRPRFNYRSKPAFTNERGNVIKPLMSNEPSWKK